MDGTVPDIDLVFRSWSSLVATASALFVAEAVYTSVGFGAGLIAVGSLAVVLPEVRDVVVILLLVNLPIELAIIARSFRSITWRGVALIATGVVLGAPAGAHLLRVGDATFILDLLGGFLIFIGAVFLVLRDELEVRFHPWMPPVAGLCSGVLAGLFGTGGPPLVLYYRLAGADKTKFRGNLMAIFLLLSVVRLPSYAFEGLLTAPRLWSSLVVLPAALLGAYAGSRIHLELSEAAFRRLVAVLLLAIGLVLLSR